MTTEGLEGIYIETHDWAQFLAFWTSLGFAVEFETDHHSGMLRHPNGGPYLFANEVPAGQNLGIHPILRVDDAAAFEPPAAGTVEQPFEPTHWDALEMRLGDPDGRVVSLQAPVKR